MSNFQFFKINNQIFEKAKKKFTKVINMKKFKFQIKFKNFRNLKIRNFKTLKTTISKSKILKFLSLETLKF